MITDLLEQSWKNLFVEMHYSWKFMLIFLLISPSAPVFYFDNQEYNIDESDGHVEVRVWRTGTDLSKKATVTVRSRKTDPVSAEGV